MQVVPSIDLRQGRSRLVFWPGAATGTGTPTDRADRIARHFVELGAPMLHLVDLDGAAAGRPTNIDAIQAVARTAAVPLQLAGGVDGPEQVELAFAAGATRVVVPLWAVAESREALHELLTIARDWLAVGLDARPERLAEYPWRGSAPTSLEALVGRLVEAGVGRFVLSHGGAAPDPERLGALCRTFDAEFLVAGGITSLDGVRAVRDLGVAGLILGEALFTGAVDFAAAAAAAAATRDEDP